MPTADNRALRGGEDNGAVPPAGAKPEDRWDPWAALWRTAGPALVVLVLFLMAWWATDRFGEDPYELFPGPVEVALSLVELIEDGQLWPHLQVTMDRLVRGFLISILLGGAIAIAMARWSAVDRGLTPYLLGLQSLPSIAWVPLAIIWFGYAESSYIFVTVIGSVFAVTISFTDALNSVRPAHVLAARNMGSRGLGLLVRVKIPAAMPPIVSGVKQCWSFAWRSLLGAEIVILSIGLGWLLNAGREFQDTSQVLAVMVITLVLGTLFEVLLFTRVEVWVRRRWGLVK